MIRGRYYRKTAGTQVHRYHPMVWPAALLAIAGFCHLFESEEVIKAPATSDFVARHAVPLLVVIAACCHSRRASARLLHQYILTTTLLMMFAASSTRSALLLKCR